MSPPQQADGEQTTEEKDNASAGTPLKRTNSKSKAWNILKETSMKKDISAYKALVGRLEYNLATMVRCLVAHLFCP